MHEEEGRTRFAPLTALGGVHAPGRMGSRGAALLVALPLLLIVTLLGITGMRNTLMQERMAGNLRDRNLAFQAAEAALREGERRASNVASPPVGFDPTDNSQWETVFVDNNGGTPYSIDIEGLAARPRYFVEELADMPGGGCPQGQVCDVEFGAMETRSLFRITARGVGGSEDAVVILQTTVMQ